MKLKQIIISLLIVIAFLISSCAFYSFSGSTLPSHLKSVDLPLFANATLQPGVAEDITQELNREILSSNLLRIVSDDGDATISGTVMSYSNDPHTFGATDDRQVDVDQYKVRISVEVLFSDNKRNEPLYSGTVTGEGIYDFRTENEEHGKTRAIKEIVERVMQNSVQSW